MIICSSRSREEESNGEGHHDHRTNKFMIQQITKASKKAQQNSHGPSVSTTRIISMIKDDDALRDTCLMFSRNMGAASGFSPMILQKDFDVNLMEKDNSYYKSNPNVSVTQSSMLPLFHSVSVRIQWRSPIRGMVWTKKSKEEKNGPLIYLIAHMTNVIARNSASMHCGPKAIKSRIKILKGQGLVNYRILDIDLRDGSVIHSESGVQQHPEGPSAGTIGQKINIPKETVVVQVTTEFTNVIKVSAKVLGKRQRTVPPVKPSLKSSAMESEQPARKKMRSQSNRNVVFCTKEEQEGPAMDKDTNFALSGFPRRHTNPPEIPRHLYRVQNARPSLLPPKPISYDI